MNNGDARAYRGSLHRRTLELIDWHSRILPEEAMEPELPIVDPHHHLYGVVTDDHYYRIDDLKRDLVGGHRIIATVYVEAYEAGWHQTGPKRLRPVGEVETIVGLTGTPIRNPHGTCEVAAGVVAHADLTLGDAVAEVLGAQVAAGQGRLRGVRHAAAYDSGVVGRFAKGKPRPHLLSDATFRRGLAQLNQFGLSFEAWVYHPQLGEVGDLADAFPETPIILNHLGGLIGVGEYRAERAANFAQWRRDLRSLAARSNVSVKVGGLGMPVFGFGFEHAERPATSAELAQAWWPLIEVCIEAFGPRRCMFEGNFPVDKQSCGYTELWNAFKLATRSLSTDERHDLFHRTACRVYRLPADRLLTGSGCGA